MKKFLTALTASAIISATPLAMSDSANAQWGRGFYRGFGYHGLRGGYGGYRALGWGYGGYRGLGWGYGGYRGLGLGYGGLGVGYGGYGCGSCGATVVAAPVVYYPIVVTPAYYGCGC